MARSGIALVVLLFLAACSGGVAEGNAPGALARFPPGGAQDIIQVTIADRLPARTIELVGPDGLVQPAYTINTDTPRGDYGARPSFGLGVGGGNRGFSSGVGVGIPLGGYGSGGGGSAGNTISNGYIRLPDRGSYLQTWRGWYIRVRLGDPPGETRIFEIEAPPPPA
jgi:hypothetical protein